MPKITKQIGYAGQPVMIAANPFADCWDHPSTWKSKIWFGGNGCFYSINWIGATFF
jgi:hypothetical protein